MDNDDVIVNVVVAPVVGRPIVITPEIIVSKPVMVNVSAGADRAALWTGEGEPHLVMGAKVGDEYMDTLTGILYRLDPGV